MQKSKGALQHGGGQAPRVAVVLAGFFWVAVIGLIDYLSGLEVSVSIFYLPPVALVAWHFGLWPGLFIAFTGALVWMIADMASGRSYSHLLVPTWNAAVRLGFFIIVAVVLWRRRQAEALTRQTRERFERLFEFAPDPVVVIDGQGQVLQANEQVTQVFGYGRKELIGSPVERLFPDRFRTEKGGYITHPAKGPKVVATELYGLHKDGREFPIEIQTSPIGFGDSQELLAVIRDMTARRWAEQRFRERGVELEEVRATLRQQEERLAKAAEEITSLKAQLGVRGST